MRRPTIWHTITGIGLATCAVSLTSLAILAVQPAQATGKKCPAEQVMPLNHGGQCTPRPCPTVTLSPSTIPTISLPPVITIAPSSPPPVMESSDPDDADRVSLLGRHHPRPSCSPSSSPTSVPPTTRPTTTPPTTRPTSVPPTTTSPAPSPSASDSPSATETAPPPTSGTGGDDDTDTSGTAPVSNDLPLTGPAITMFAVSGAAAIGAGAVLVYVVRRRKTRYVA